jgi:hypothetical protein
MDHKELARLLETELEAKPVVTKEAKPVPEAELTELLEALKELTGMVNRQKDFNDDGDGSTIDRAEAAIAKAEGRESRARRS